MIKFRYDEDETYDLPEGALRYAQRTSEEIRRAIGAHDPAFAGHDVAYLDTDYMVRPVLERLKARPLPVRLGLRVARLSEEPTVERWTTHQMRRGFDETDKRVLVRHDALALDVDGAPLVVVTDTVYNGMVFQEHDFVVYRDARQLDAFNALYVQTVRSIVSDRGLIVDLTDGSMHPKPQASMDEVVLPAALKKDLVENTVGFFETREAYAQLGLPWRRGVILAGPPGNGKTTFLKALACALAHPFATMHLGQHTSDYDLLQMFRRAQKIAPCAVVIEDLDRAEETRFNLSTLLNAIDGLEEIGGILILATTNRPERIDPALLSRPSRFDRKYLFDLPDRAQKLALVRVLSRGRFAEAAIERELRDSDGFSMATVRECVVTAFMRAAAERRAPDDRDLAEGFRVMRAEVRSSREGLSGRRDVAGFGAQDD